jgi:hypothetical protein
VSSLLMAAENSLPAIFVLMAIFTVGSALACWRGWGVDIHKHLEETDVAYDELHPEQRAEQERRAAD